MIKVRSAEALDGYRLQLAFSDGSSGIADLSEYVARRPFAHVKANGTFRNFAVEHGAVEWLEDDVGIAPEALYALVHGLPKPDTIEQVRANELEVSLRELRKIAGKTQVDVAEEAGLTQSALSQFESATDRRLSTLRRYVEALGGELEVVAVIGSVRYTIRGA